MKTKINFFVQSFIMSFMFLSMNVIGQNPIMVDDINSDSISSHSNPSYLIEFNDKLFFAADDGINGTELWTYDIINDTAVLISDLNPGKASSNPQYLTVFNDKLYFRASDGTNGRELWEYDGRTGGP